MQRRQRNLFIVVGMVLIVASFVIVLPTKGSINPAIMSASSPTSTQGSSRFPLPPTSTLSPEVQAPLTAYASVTPTATFTPTETPTSSSQILVVTRLDDTNDGVCDSDCSLREAIQNADYGATINFAPNLKGTLKLNSEFALVKSITINGPGPKSNVITLDGGGTHGIFISFMPIELTLSQLTLSNGKGGAGGAIWMRHGILVISDCTFQNNQATAGGAIDIDSVVATIRRSTFIKNKATSGAAVENIIGQVAIINSTFVENFANGSAVFNSGGGQVTVVNSTFMNNISMAGGTLGSFPMAGASAHTTLTIANSLIVNTSDNDECRGVITDQGNNIEFPHHDCGSIPVIDPHLGALSDNGGATNTIPLLPGSPAISAGNPKICQENKVDQRNIPYEIGQPCSIGAVQYTASAASPTEAR